MLGRQSYWPLPLEALHPLQRLCARPSVPLARQLQPSAYQAPRVLGAASPQARGCLSPKQAGHLANERHAGRAHWLTGAGPVGLGPQALSALAQL